MQTGTLAMHLDLLKPSTTSLDAVMGALVTADFSKLARRVIAHGYDVLEISTDLMSFLPGLFSIRQMQRLAALRAQTGVQYTVHLPFWSVELSSPVEAVRAGSLAATVEAVHMTEALSPQVYILHATGHLAAEFVEMGLQGIMRRVTLGRFMDAARRSLEQILRKTGLPSRRLAVENVQFPLDLTLNLAQEFDLGFCFDTGHLLGGFSGPYDVYDALQQVLPRLVEVHLHDSPQCPPERPGHGLDHQALGKGDLDVRRLLGQLQAAGWDGPLVLETRTLADANRSLEVLYAAVPELAERFPAIA